MAEMTPQNYLNELGKEYFYRVAEILESRGMAKEEFSIELSMLCNEYAKYEMAVIKTNKEGEYQTAKTGWLQIAPWITVQKEALATVQKLSPKYGMTPADFEKIKDYIKAPEEENELDLLMKSLNG